MESKTKKTVKIFTLIVAFTFLVLLSTAGTALALDDLTSVSDNADGLECIALDTSLEVEIILGLPEDLVELLLLDIPHQVASRGGIPTGVDEPNGTWSLHYDTSVDFALLTGVTINPCLVAGFTIAQSGGSTSVSESGTTDTFTVVLNTQPASNVVLSISPSDSGEATTTTSLLTFTRWNWNTPQTVTVTGINDYIIDGTINSTLTLAIVDAITDDNFYDVADQTVSVATTDDDDYLLGTPEELAESCTYEFATPETGELLTSNDDCTWGVIEFLPGDCLSGEILIEFESSFYEHVQIVVNGSNIIDSYMVGGEYIFDVSEFLTPEYNDVNAYVGVEGQTFFMIGSLEPCDPPSVEEISPRAEKAPPEAEETPPEAEEVPPVEETPETPLFTNGTETLPTTGGKHQIMLILALTITCTGMALVYLSRPSYK